MYLEKDFMEARQPRQTFACLRRRRVTAPKQAISVTEGTQTIRRAVTRSLLCSSLLFSGPAVSASSVHEGGGGLPASTIHPLSIDYLTVSRHSARMCEKSPVVTLPARHNRSVFIDLANSMHRTGKALASVMQTGSLNRDPVVVPPVSIKEEPALPALRMAFEFKWLVAAFGYQPGAPSEEAKPAFDEGSPQGEFLSEVWLHAQAAATEVGVPPTFIIAQAALETGWGRAQLVDASGRNSHNLFNIKAGRGWSGKTVSLPVKEYENGRRVTRHETFRAYDSYQEAFADYARLLTENARYQKVLGEDDPARFAYGLQRAGFATDPAYGRKIVSIIRKIEREAMS